MKRMQKYLCYLWIGLLGLLVGFSPSEQQAINPAGAWEQQVEAGQTTLIFSDQVFASATYHIGERKFISSWGGSYRMDGDQLVITCEWNSLDTGKVGKELRFKLSKQSGKLKIDGLPGVWQAVDDGKPGELAGAWIITGTYTNDVVAKRKSPFFPRRTMKILSGKRFQWIAYNLVTKQFIDTGGGMYTTANGKYTESISFFTKTAESVGKTLSFDYSFVDGDWRHKGQKSTGGVMDECWTRREKLATKE